MQLFDMRGVADDLPDSIGPPRDLPAEYTGAVLDALLVALSGRIADAEVRRRAREIAARLSVPRPRHRRAPRRGLGRLRTLPYQDGAEELDLDRTVEILAEDPFARSTDLVMRDRIRDRRKVVLVVDISGSMRGERIRTAGAAVGAVAGELGHDDLAVVAFWSEAAVLGALGEPVSPAAFVDLLLRIPSKGLTNVGFALDVAGVSYGTYLRTRHGYCSCRIACTTPGPIRGPRPPGSPGSTCSPTSPVNTTCSPPATSLGPGGDSPCPSVDTEMSLQRSRVHSAPDGLLCACGVGGWSPK